ncbi:MAG: HAMP domain-containing sensor histidine kinase [Bacteroidota bacterium]
MEKQNTYFNTLFWKISGTFLLLLIILGVVYVFVTAYSARMYFYESSQKLNGNIAKHTVKEVKPLIDGKVDTTAIQDIMHSMMVINPSVEVYLLDTEGGIITYVAPYKKVKLDRVNLEPVNEFIDAEGSPFIFGDDPRNPGLEKVFSAAPITENGEVNGYVYIVLASEEYESVTATLLNSYMLKVGTTTFFITLLGALLIGLLAVWTITRNLRGIVRTVRNFKEGDYQARIKESYSEGELSVLGQTFNEMAATITKNIDELKKVENLRRELIANVSHDLRTPLAIMHGYVETLLMKDSTLDPEERKQYLNIVLKSTEKLKKLVTQLFELSKLEAKQIQPQKEPFFITDLAQDVYQKFQILAEEKNIKINLDASIETPMVYADVALVERVLQNLMDNALKFTPTDGKVTIGIKGGPNDVEIRITDSGPGIPESEQSYIFERYHKSETPNKKVNKLGTGLGLSIVKRILELHNSSIQVTSQPNKGASFFFNLPVYA